MSNLSTQNIKLHTEEETVEKITSASKPECLILVRGEEIFAILNEELLLLKAFIREHEKGLK